jgi:hypothetical protein
MDGWLRYAPLVLRTSIFFAANKQTVRWRGVQSAQLLREDKEDREAIDKVGTGGLWRPAPA